ncbi:protein argonaute-2-like isoform X2 [Rhopilema esculentum]
MQAMDIALRHLPSLRYVPVGRSFFQPPDIKNAYQLGQGREIWFGYHQSIRPAYWKTMINLDISSTTFYKSQPVTDFLNEVLDKVNINENKRPLGDHERIRFSKEVKGLKVEVTHLGNIKRKYKVTGVTKESANEKTFTMEKDGANADVTVAAYFEERYKMKLRYPYLPCLQVGNPERGCFLPMEVCNIVSGQRCAKKLSDRQTREMIKNTPKSASMRKEEIMKIVNKADFAKDPYLRYFGIEVSPQMVKVEGRILEPPTIEFGQMAQVLPRNGAWNLQDRAFHSAKKINVWVLLVLGSSQHCKQRVLMKFADEFVDVCSTAGMSVERKPTHFEYLRLGSTEVVGKQFERVIDTVLNNNTSLDLIIVVLNGKNPCYELIKSLGDTYYGIPTQCVQYKNIEPLRRQTIVNLSLKVNTKLGGINSFIKRECKPKIFEKPVIVLGADVTHPAPGDEQKPSIAAVVGSLDSYPMNYSTSIRVQKNRMEIIAELKDMIKELLNAFRNSTGHKPERIIMYRDGVSEGQFQQVLLHEVKAIREACMMLEKDYEPGITFIVVQKRHHARFFPERHQDAVGTSGNIPPGTTVDSGICHPTEYDFYLCSHAGIKGTSRPAHYHVLWDDNDLKPDELHNLTYMLCHTYVRCTRSVSIPAPAYYAHLAAFRARFHVDYQRDISAGSDQGGSSSKKSISEAALKTLGDACRPHKKLSKTIYFA